MNILEPDATSDVLRDLALCRLGVNLRGRVQKRDDVGGGSLRGGDVGDEGEHVAGLDGGECRTLSWKVSVLL